MSKAEKVIYWSGAIFLGIGIAILAIALSWRAFYSVDWEWPMLMIIPMGYIIISVFYFVIVAIDENLPEVERD